MKNSNVWAITDTAVAAALCALLVVIAAYVPFLSLPVSFTVSVPLVYIAHKHNIKLSVASCLCSTLVCYFITGNVLSVSLLMLTFAVPGLVFGICSRRKIKFPVSVAISAGAVLLGVMAELLIINGDSDGILNMIKTIINNTANMISTAAYQANIPSIEAEALMKTVTAQATNLLMLSLPTLVIAISVIYAYIISMVDIFFMKKFRITNIDYTRFYMICAPRRMCIITVLLFLIIQLGGIEGTASAALQNLYNLSVLYISICGLSAIDYSLRNKIPHGIIRATIYILVFLAGFMLSSFIMTILTVIGFMDGLRERRLSRKL